MVGRGVDQRLKVVADRLRLREAQNSAFTFEGVDAATNVGGGLGGQSACFRRDGEMLNLRKGGFATRNPGKQELGVGGFAGGRGRLLDHRIAGADSLDDPAECGIDIVDLSKHDRFGELSGLRRGARDFRDSFAVCIGGQLSQQVAQGHETLKITGVREDCGFGGGLDRGFEPHEWHLPVRPQGAGGNKRSAKRSASPDAREGDRRWSSGNAMLAALPDRTGWIGEVAPPANRRASSRPNFGAISMEGRNVEGARVLGQKRVRAVGGYETRPTLLRMNVEAFAILRR